jgi:GrpB-like predicted nucleotidyltransferase (UPF0157 family)
MELKEKYKFRPYSENFSILASNEIERIGKSIDTSDIEHVGSTAVPGLGGKGVIDILMVAPKEKWVLLGEKLTTLGYEYREKASDPEKRRFFHANLPDEELGTRLYHLHLVYPESTEIKKMIGFRDYLRAHPEDTKKYAEIKEIAAKAVANLATKDEMKEKYGEIKRKFIESILAKI